LRSANLSAKETGNSLRLSFLLDPEVAVQLAASLGMRRANAVRSPSLPSVTPVFVDGRVSAPRAVQFETLCEVVRPGRDLVESGCLVPGVKLPIRG
jgi:hypothetical protein